MPVAADVRRRIPSCVEAANAATIADVVAADVRRRIPSSSL
jgi:hypothetical protein